MSLFDRSNVADENAGPSWLDGLVAAGGDNDGASLMPVVLAGPAVSAPSVAPLDSADSGYTTAPWTSPEPVLIGISSPTLMPAAPIPSVWNPPSVQSLVINSPASPAFSNALPENGAKPAPSKSLAPLALIPLLLLLL